MRVIHLYDGHESIYGGQGSLPRIVWNVARRTAARDHDVTIVERRWDGLRTVDKREGVAFRRIALGTGATEPWAEVPYEMVESQSGLARLVADRTNFGLKALRLLQGLEFDVLHVHLPFAANVLVTVAPWLRSRMIFTAQLGELRLDALTEGTDGEAPNVPQVVRRFSPDIHLSRRVACTTVLNPHVRDVFERNGVKRENLAHVPNGVDVEKFADIDQEDCTRFRKKHDLGDDPVVLLAGTIMPRKGVLELVRAAADVVESGHENVRFVLAGEAGLDEKYRHRVESVIERHEIEKNVLFTGYLTDDDLLPAYRTAQLFVLPSFEEGFGMVVSEALAAGTPVVASRINGVKQQIDEGVTGTLIEPGRADLLAAAISELLDNDRKRESMGKEGQRRARRFGWESITDQYVSLYERIVSERAAATLPLGAVRSALGAL